jgi:hypothetical protein
MKGLKLSKVSWLILSAGVFIVVLAGLGLTRSQQLKEQTKLNDELSLNQKMLGTVQTTQLSQQLENLRGKVEESESQLKEAQARLHQTVISVDVTDAFFKIAAYCSVNVTNLSTTTISQSKYEGITISTISLNARVTGEKKNIINFIISLNNGYVTGNVQSAQITFASTTDQGEAPVSGGESGVETGAEPGVEPGEGQTLDTGLADAAISMLIYSYEGS